MSMSQHGWISETLAQRDRLHDLICEFVEADAEMDRRRENGSFDDLSKVFDRYDAAVAALKEAVK